jgi:hypothetical protein
MILIFLKQKNKFNNLQQNNFSTKKFFKKKKKKQISYLKLVRKKKTIRKKVN